MASLIKNKIGRWSLQFGSAKRRTIGLGRKSVTAAQSIKVHVEHLYASSLSGNAAPAATSAWLGTIDEKLKRQLARCGLIGPLAAPSTTEIGAFAEAYIAGRTDVKPRTILNLRRVKANLVEFFDVNRDLRTINKGEANDWVRHLRLKLGGPTVAGRVKKARQIFRDAIDRKLIDVNPFAGIKLPGQANAARNRYILASDVQKVIDACPDAEWRLIFAMARFAGLRMPSELFPLRWIDLDWSKNQMVIHSPKTEHHENRDKRTIPIFPAIKPYLLDCLALAEVGSADIIVRHRGENLRTQAERIIAKAGIKQWPRLFQNLRASCETDLATIHPIHVVCEWIGNTQLIAMKHYLKVTDEDFARAAKSAAVQCGLMIPTLAANVENAINNAVFANHIAPTGREHVEKTLGNLRDQEKALQETLQSVMDELPRARTGFIRLLQSAVAQASAGRAE